MPFAGHLFSNDYTWKHLKIDMAKVALVMSTVCNKNVKNETFQNLLIKIEHYADTQFFWEKSHYLGMEIKKNEHSDNLQQIINKMGKKILSEEEIVLLACREIASSYSRDEKDYR
jgi:hypothetical protein